MLQMITLDSSNIKCQFLYHTVPYHICCHPLSFSKSIIICLYKCATMHVTWIFHKWLVSYFNLVLVSIREISQLEERLKIDKAEKIKTAKEEEMQQSVTPASVTFSESMSPAELAEWLLKDLGSDYKDDIDKLKSKVTMSVVGQIYHVVCRQQNQWKCISSITIRKRSFERIWPFIWI